MMKKQTAFIFVFTIILGIGTIFLNFPLRTLLITLPIAFSIPSPSANILMLMVVAIATLNLVMICLAWRWEGRGEPIKGVKALGWLLVGEFVLFVLIPTALKLSL